MPTDRTPPYYVSAPPRSGGSASHKHFKRHPSYFGASASVTSRAATEARDKALVNADVTKALEDAKQRLTLQRLFDNNPYAMHLSLRDAPSFDNAHLQPGGVWGWLDYLTADDERFADALVYRDRFIAAPLPTNVKSCAASAVWHARRLLIKVRESPRTVEAHAYFDWPKGLRMTMRLKLHAAAIEELPQTPSPEEVGRRLKRVYAKVDERAKNA